MNLDDQLKEIARPGRPASSKEKTKQIIRLKLEKDMKSTNWSYRIVLVTVCLLALFLVSTINNVSLPEREQAATPFGDIDEHTTIEKVTILKNMNPERNLNIDSIFYPLKKSTTEHDYFDEILDILQAAKSKAVPWYGTIYDEYSIFDYQFHFSNGDKLYLKLNTNQSMFIIDPQAKMKYELTKKEWSAFNTLAYEINYGEKWSTTKKVIFWTLIVLFLVISIVLEKKEKRKLKEFKEENEKPYTFLSFITKFSGILLLNYLQSKNGSLHIGMIASYLIIFLGIDYVIKYILQKQPLFLRYIISDWALLIVLLSTILFFFQ